MKKYNPAFRAPLNAGYKGGTMNVRFKKTGKGEVAILPRKEYEVLAAKAAEADEDIGTARLVARARKAIAAGTPLIPKTVIDRMKYVATVGWAKVRREPHRAHRLHQPVGTAPLPK